MQRIIIMGPAACCAQVQRQLALLDAPTADAAGETGLRLGVNALTAVGPVAGGFVAVAWWLFRRFPIEK